MNSLGFWIAAALIVGIGTAFSIDPSLDLAVSRLFTDPAHGDFFLQKSDVIYYARHGAMWAARAAVVPAVLAVALKLAFPHRRALIPGRAAVLLIATLALGPGLLVNGLLKEHSHRPRPSQVVEFHGAHAFMPWHDFRGACPTNCSFVSGDVAIGFWTVAIAAVTPAPYRVSVYVAALSFGTAIALMRMAVGSHFFTDVAFAALFTFLIVWLVHGLLYRWRMTRIDDAAIEKALAAVGLSVRTMVAALIARVFRLMSGASRPR